MKLRNFSILSLAALACGSLSARADLTPIATSGSWDGDSPGTLVTVMQHMVVGQPTYDANAAVNRVDDSSDQVWTSSTGGSSTLLLAIAGYAGQNSFGIFNLSDPTERLQIFGGGAPPSSTAVAVNFNAGMASIGVGGTPVNVGANFGFYLQTPNTTYYSVEADNGGDGDHMVTLTTSTAQTLNPQAAAAGWPAANSLAWNPGSYILGWEDLPLLPTGSSDNDYQDLVVEVTGFTPVPEPTTMIAGASLLLPFGASAMRRFRRNKRV